MKTTFIYALCEPGTRTVRYIGKAKDLNIRLSQHCRKSSATRGTHLGHWLGSLQAAKKSPEILKLAEVPDESWAAEEMRYIRAARMLGMHLVNSTDGGEGVTLTPEIHQKMVDAWKNRAPDSDETRAKKSAAGKARTATPEQLAALETHRYRGGGSLKGKDHPRFGKPGTMLGRKHKGASSKYLGVTWGKNFNRWVSRISFNGRLLALGCFGSEEEAARAYDACALELFGNTVKLNFPIS